MENGLKATIDSDIQLLDTTQTKIPMEIEANHNNTHIDATAQVKKK